MHRAKTRGYALYEKIYSLKMKSIARLKIFKNVFKKKCIFNFLVSFKTRNI